MEQQPPSKMTRVRGWVLVVLSIGLLIGLYLIRKSIAPGFAAPGVAIDGQTFTGTAEQGAQALALIDAVLVLAGAFAANGAYMAATGRTHPLLQGLTFLLALAFAAVLYTTKASFA